VCSSDLGFIMHHAIKKLRELLSRDMAEETSHTQLL
jgi:hypothetical protein